MNWPGSANKHSWGLPDSASLSKFITFLSSHGQLQTHVFRSEAYGRDITRYSWGPPSPYAMAIALKPRGYLSHGSAAILHGLATPDPKTLYLNVEQSEKPAPRGGLPGNWTRAVGPSCADVTTCSF